MPGESLPAAFTTHSGHLELKRWSSYDRLRPAQDSGHCKVGCQGLGIRNHVPLADCKETTGHTNSSSHPSTVCLAFSRSHHESCPPTKQLSQTLVSAFYPLMAAYSRPSVSGRNNDWAAHGCGMVVYQHLLYMPHLQGPRLAYRLKSRLPPPDMWAARRPGVATITCGRRASSTACLTMSWGWTGALKTGYRPWSTGAPVCACR